MRITIIGATGGVGRRVLEQAVVARHRVTAVVRDPAKLSRHLSACRDGVVSQAPTDGARPVVCVTVTDLAAPDADLLEAATEGSDAVISALGPRSPREIRIADRGTRAIIRAMRATDVRRLVVVSAAPGSIHRPPELPNLERYDLALMEDVVRDSDLDWTIVRAAQLTDGPLTGRYRTAYGASLNGGPGVARADVAHFMLRALEQPLTIGQTVAIAGRWLPASPGGHDVPGLVEAA